MKYLKIFEDFNSPNEIVEEIKDICLELNDDYIDVNCEYYPLKIINGTISGNFISLGMEKMDFHDYNDFLSWGNISETIDRILEYLNSVGWKLSSIIIDGDNLTNPEQWIENLRNKSEYTFYGVTFHFIRSN